MTVTRQIINYDSAQLFDVPKDVIYLNTAGLAPRLHSVTRAAEEGLYASARLWEAGADDWIVQTEQLRALAAELLNTTVDALAFTPSVSYAMAVAARNCPVHAGQNLIVLDAEYPSNRGIWQQQAEACGAHMRYAVREAGQDWTSAVLAQMDASTAVLSIPHCHWADGSLLNLEQIAAEAHRLGAALVIDASQSIGVMALDLETIAPDFVVVPGHKWLLGAYGLGWLWAAPKHCERGEPIEQTILAREASCDFASMGRTLPAYRSGARRFDFGPFPHPLSVPMSMAALQQMQAWGIDEIEKRLNELSTHFRDALVAKGLGQGLSAEPVAPHLIAWRPEDRCSLERLSAALHEQGIFAVPRGGALRFSPHLHISELALDRVVDVMCAALT